MARYYKPGCSGYVVRVAPIAGTHPSWWYGPDHGFGTTSGPLDYSAAVFVTREGARLALARGGYGRRTPTRIVTVAAAEREAGG